MNAAAVDTGLAPLLQVRGLTKEFAPRRVWGAWSGRGGGRRLVSLALPAPSEFSGERQRDEVQGTPAVITKAVDGISFDLHAGESFGLVGESGSGKTTVVRCILRAMRPTAGTVQFRLPNRRIVDLASLPERELAAVRPHVQMIFQDPYSSLNPRLTVHDIVAEPLQIHRLARGAELEDRVVEMLRRVGLSPDHRRRYPHAFSGGQRQRISIARALIMRPSLVVCDEATSALDVTVQAQVLELLLELQREFSLTYLFVAHNLEVVHDFCHRVAVMRKGRIVEQAPTEEIFSNPRHPYTRLLLSAAPSLDPDVPMNFEVGEALGRLEDGGTEGT